MERKLIEFSVYGKNDENSNAIRRFTWNPILNSSNLQAENDRLNYQNRLLISRISNERKKAILDFVELLESSIFIYEFNKMICADDLERYIEDILKEMGVFREQ